MIYVLAWFVIGFTCTLLIQSYLSNDYMQFMLDKLHKDGRITDAQYNDVNVSALRVLFSGVVILYGPFAIIEYYNTKTMHKNFLDQKNKTV